MELVLSRGCRHMDWCEIPSTSIEFCRSCGFAIIYSSFKPSRDEYAEVQVQPSFENTFDLPNTKRAHGAYQYRPLDLFHGCQIRILILKAGDSEDELRCELEHANLQHSPIYEAVSYTWADEKGNDSLCRTILWGSNDHFIAITKNCEAALRRLRKPGVDRRLWVDAVCIDQTNTLERNHQVKNMIAIFRSAQRVLVFLGDGISKLDRLVDYIGNDTGGQLPLVFDFVSLFQSRWFHRVWVVQEIAVAKNAIVIYGEKHISWEDLLEHSNLILRLMADRQLSMVLPPVLSYGLRQTISGDRRLKKSELLSLLQISRNCSCKDPRDKVYAITGLLPDRSALPIQADYSADTTAGWVFLQAAAWHISTTQSIEILLQVNGQSNFFMPSWVPDWTKKSPIALPSRLQQVGKVFGTSFTSRDGSVLPPIKSLAYPLKCALQTSGWRTGTIWTDKALLAAQYPQSLKGAMEEQAHWLRFPSKTGKRTNCVQRLNFWNRILSTYDLRTSFSPSEIDITFSAADVPPAFGGPCINCFGRDMFCQGFPRYSPVECICTFTSPEPVAHFYETELYEFATNLNRYGSGQKLFGTEHSLGFGPMEIRDGDEVWFLDDATVPFVLRQVDDHYILVGACYLHAATRRDDRCAICSADISRQETTEYLTKINKPESSLPDLGLVDIGSPPPPETLLPRPREEPIVRWATTERILIW